MPPRSTVKSSQDPKTDTDKTQQQQEESVSILAMATEGIINEEILEEEEEEEDPEEDPEEEEEPEEWEEPEEGGEVEEEAEEIPEPIKEKRRQKEFEVFVGGLHRDATESNIEMAFKKVGEVVEVRLAKDLYSNKNKGFAFVRFATVDQAKKAANEIKQIVVKGKPCGVIRNKDSVTLHIGNICTSWTKDDLVETLKAFDLENLEDVHLIDDPHNRGKNRGYAFVDFSTHMDAVEACSKLRRGAFFFGTGVRADITISKTIEPDEEVMAQVKSVFLDGFPVSWDEAQLRERLKKFGEIESIQLACDMPTAKRKDFGFICFTTREAALDCIEKVNRDGIGEGDDKVHVKASLKKPLEKRGQLTLGVRGGYISKRVCVRGKQSYGYARSFRGRPTRSYESMDRGFGDRSRAPSRFPSRGRGSGFRTAMSTTPRKFGSRFRRGSSGEIPADTAVPSRPRVSYYQSGSSSRCTPKRHYFYATTYSQLRRPYSDDGYDHHETYEHDDMPAYEYDDTPGYKYDGTTGYEHYYSELDHDMPVSRSQPQQERSRSGLEMASYQDHGYPAYDEYSRFSLDEQLGCEREYGSRRENVRQYYYGRGTSRSFN